MTHPAKITTLKKPDWLKTPLPKGSGCAGVNSILADDQLATVCRSARCPNQGECWARGTATFMILGETCTRGCRFCAVKTADTGQQIGNEPEKVARAVARMKLKYAVITSVTRDDLPDGGAKIFANTIAAVKALPHQPKVEVLTSDYSGDDLNTVLAAKPTVFAHNVEVVERLSDQMRHKRFSYVNSLATLQEAAAHHTSPITKSSIMLGVGETEQEILCTMDHLRDAGVSILVLGQYLQPTRHHAAVARYVSPEEFKHLENAAYAKGFGYVAAGPLVRTSYKAEEAFMQCR